MATTPMCALFLALSLLPLSSCKGGQEVKGMFVFGSSLVDNGNNNFLANSRARADYPPYGIDFPHGATGRFSNGRNPIDVLGELLKLPSLIPPFADPTTRGAKIVHGVNYASGGSGILNQTGSIGGEVISLDQQINNFETVTLPDLRARAGGGGHRRLARHLGDYLFVVGTGGNDYLLNYFARSNAANKPSLTEFTTSLIASLSSQLKKLYHLGARKFVLFSIQAMGCMPVVRANLQASNGSCVEAMNQVALLFNSHLRSVVRDKGNLMPGSTMVYINSYKIIMDIIDNPTHHGFSDIMGACCELSAIGGGILCEKGGNACGDRAMRVFFDGLHPTDAVNEKIGCVGYGSRKGSEVYPINVKQLAYL